MTTRSKSGRQAQANYSKPIEDFEAYIATTDSEKGKAKVQRWINTLRAGKNPFTDTELKSLLKL